MKNIYILGISGTFMSGLALLAKEAGFHVSGCDANCYPPVSDLLQAKGIEWQEGYEVNDAFLQADLVIVGNAMKRGMPIVEAMLSSKKPYTSGPQWLFEHILHSHRVIAVAGTHGKTTTTSMIAHILDSAGLKPSFLIGGVAPGFQTNARLGKGEWFVIEADEYDSAFFDKRPKLMHYHPEIAILNNLEFDHADIYPDLAAIEQQFHYYLKTIPAEGVILKPRDDEALNRVIERGLFSHLEEMAFDEPANWRAELLDASGSHFAVWHQGARLAEVRWSLIGKFNVENGLAALAASQHAGVDLKAAAKALSTFSPVKRRLELKADVNGIAVYDDFAHHPTAMMKTIQALRKTGRHDRIWVVFEFASYTMKTGVHAEKMAEVLQEADEVVVLEPAEFSLTESVRKWSFSFQVMSTTQAMIDALVSGTKSGDAILIMSNRGFENLHERLIKALEG